MSKAFTKETDNEEEPERSEEDSVAFAHKNYVTPGGYADLQNELRELIKVERPKIVETVRWAAGNGDRSEKHGDYIYGKKRLREIDRRVRYLTKRIESAEVVDPKRQQGLSKIFFGAKVTYKQDGVSKELQIVGIDEADLSKNKVSWISPVAKALIKAEVGDVVKVSTPAGVEVFEVLAIHY